MSKKIILVLSAVVFLFGFKTARAEIVINEIMYDLPGADSVNNKSREWVEIYNPGAADVAIDASKWRFYDGGANRTINGEADFIIPANSYVIFAGDKDTFLLDHPDFGEVVYDTGFSSLNNTGGTLKILDQDGHSADETVYASSQGGNGNGNSLQKISGSWGGSAPTPGSANENVPLPSPSSNDSSDNASDSSSDSSNGGSGASGGGSFSSGGSSKTAETKKIKTEITAKTLGFVGLPLSLDAAAFGLNEERLHYGKYFWNFGDGDSKEINLSDSQLFIHTYFYPGDYLVSLDYFSNPYIYADIPDASDKITVKIISADIAISRVGEEKDFFVELSNNTDYGVNLSNWFLASGVKSFTIPRNTILPAKKKMIIPPQISNFSIADKDTLKLMNSAGGAVFDYSASVAPIIPAKIAAEKNIAPVKLSANKTKNLNNENVTKKAIAENVTKNLPALALPSGPVGQDEKNSPSFPIIPVASFIFIGASAGAVYFVRRKKVIPRAGDEFEILDE